MAKDYRPSHDYQEPEAESRTVSEKFLGRSKSALRFSRYLLLCILVLVLAITVMVNRNNINMDNLRRMMAKIDIGISSQDAVDGKEIEFAFEEDAVVHAFKDGLAYVTPSKLTVMDNLGTIFMTTETGFTTPELICGERYIVAYDRGGNRLLVTNSFAVVFQTELKEKIMYVSMSDENYLSVLTSGGDYKNSLYVYDSSFKEIFVWHSNERYLLNAAVSPDRKTVALVCYNLKEAKAAAELVGIRLDQEEITWSTALNSLPLEMCYKSNNQIALLFDDRLEFYNGKGKAGNVYQYEKNFLQGFSLTKDRTVLLLSAGKLGDSTLYEINNRGKAVCQYDAQARVTSMDARGNKVALLTNKETIVYSLSSKRVTWQQESNANIHSVCFAGKDCILDIYSTYCVYNEIK